MINDTAYPHLNENNELDKVMLRPITAKIVNYWIGRELYMKFDSFFFADLIQVMRGMLLMVLFISCITVSTLSTSSNF